MWLIRRVVLSTVFIMLLYCSEGAPNSATPQFGLPESDNEFLKLLGGDNDTSSRIRDISKNIVEDNSKSDVCSGQRICVPFHKCCDPNQDIDPNQDYDFDIDAYRTINIDEHKNSPCNDLLTICCETVCKEDDITTISTTNTTPAPGMRHVPSTQCGASNTIILKSFIIEGIGFSDNQAQYGEFPWMVAVLEKDNTFIGGGSLVHHRIVLTAAHKVHEKLSNNLVTRIGDWDLMSTSEPVQFQQLNVEKIVIHPDFQRRTVEYNVALLVLQKDAKYTDTVMPVCLPQPGQAFAGANCFVTGWGKDVFGETGRYQSIMKKKALPVVSNSDCERMLQKTRLGPNFRLKNSFNCAGGGKENACTGDGGSPLICPDPNSPDLFVQVGIVSWGIGCGDDGSPTVFASVPKTVSWINENIEIEGGFDASGFELRTGPQQ